MIRRGKKWVAMLALAAALTACSGGGVPSCDSKFARENVAEVIRSLANMFGVAPGEKRLKQVVEKEIKLEEVAHSDQVRFCQAVAKDTGEVLFEYSLRRTGDQVIFTPNL